MKFTILTAFIASLVKADVSDDQFIMKEKHNVPWEISRQTKKGIKHHHGEKEYSDHRRQVDVDDESQEVAEERKALAALEGPVKDAHRAEKRSIKVHNARLAKKAHAKTHSSKRSAAAKRPARKISKAKKSMHALATPAAPAAAAAAPVAPAAAVPVKAGATKRVSSRSDRINPLKHNTDKARHHFVDSSGTSSQSDGA